MFNKIKTIFFWARHGVVGKLINTSIKKPDPQNLISDFKLSKNSDIRNLGILIFGF